MALTTHPIPSRIGMICRNVAVSLIAGVCRWRSIGDINAAVKSRPLPMQAMITAGVIATLFGLSFVAGYFGWVGLLVFWLAVVVLVN